MENPTQNHCLELYGLLVELFRNQHSLPQGTTMLQVARMNDDERRILMETLSRCRKSELGDTTVTLKQIKQYAKRAHEEIVIFEMPFNPTLVAAA